MSEENMFDDIDTFFDHVESGHHEDSDSNEVEPYTGVIKPTVNNNLALFYQKLASMGFNLDELQEILECPNSMLILSAAGSGKTTALILKIIRDLLAGDIMKIVDTPNGRVVIPAKILVSTFLKTGSEELKESFNSWCRKLGITGVDSSTITFKTIHAEVLDALKQMGVKVDILESTDPLLRSVMQAYSIRSVLSTSRNVTADEVSDVSCILTYARNRLDAKRYEHSLMNDYSLNTLVMDAILLDFKRRRAATGKLDFEDMQEMLLDALRINPNVAEFIANRYDYVYVDEFQDTAQLQYEILKYYFAGCKKIICIGDDDQTIYSWRGSDIDIIISKFEEDYHPEVKQLTMNYRCAKNILEAVAPSIEMNTKRHPKQLRGCKPNGELTIVTDSDVNHLMRSIQEDLASNKTVGVLARTNADLIVPAILLELDGGVDFSVSKSVNLNSRIPRQVFGLMDLITKRFTEEFESHFKLFLSKYYYYEAEKLDSVLRINKEMTLYTIPIRDLEHSVPRLAPIIKGLREAVKQDKVLGYLFLLDALINYVYTGKSIYAQKAVDFTRLVKKLIMEHSKLKDMEINDLDHLFNNVLPERLARRVKYGKSIFIKLTTIHEAKGKEWDSVYIWNDIEGCFPNSVGNRELTIDEFEEERRVHYIAWTRARSKLTVFTNTDRLGPFLKECDLTQANVTQEEVQKDEARMVYRKRPTEDVKELDVERLVREYIVEVTSSGNLMDEKVANAELVSQRYPMDDLVEKMKTDYKIEGYPEDSLQDVLPDIFEDLVNKLFNAGDFATAR